MPRTQESQEYPHRSEDGRLVYDDLREILITLQAEFECSGDFLLMHGALYIQYNLGRMWSN